MKYVSGDIVWYYNYVESKPVVLRIDHITVSKTLSPIEYMVYNLILNTYTFYPVEVVDRWFIPYKSFKSKLKDLL